MEGSNPEVADRVDLDATETRARMHLLDDQLTQQQPNCPRSDIRRDVREFGFAVEVSGTSALLERIARQPLQIARADSRAVRRKKDARGFVCEFERGSEQLGQVILGLKFSSAISPRERGRIEDDHAELLSPAREPWQDVENVIGDELMARLRQTIQAEVESAPIERLAGEVDADRFRARARRDNREGTGVSEGVKEPIDPEAAHEGAVRPLVQKEPRRVARRKINVITEPSLFDRRLQRKAAVALDEFGSTAVLVLPWEQPPEDTPHGQIIRPTPLLQLLARFGQSLRIAITDEEIVSQSLDPGSGAGCEAMGVRARRGEAAKEAGVNPPERLRNRPLWPGGMAHFHA
jgi:hypothetical protein